MVFVVFIALIVAYSCDDDNSEPLPANSVTLSSETFGNMPFYSFGYSFEKHDFFQRMASTSDIDIYLAEVVNPMGQLIGVQFSTNTISESTYGFYLNAAFNDSTEADAFYNNYSVVAYNPDSATTLTGQIKEFQVYTFRTWKRNYVKFYVKDIRVIYSGELADYMKVDIDYFIQQDGSENLVN
jgi:hypothetical protein